MNILVVGSERNAAECQEKFGSTHHYQLAAEPLPWDKADVIFDFSVHDESLSAYTQVLTPIFLNTTFTTLSAIKKNCPQLPAVFGFCGLPSFLNRDVLEVSLLSPDHASDLQKICGLLQTDFAVVDDRVGLVTPRIICMIINEAYYTVQEGTASRKDIDLAMKLGTNYPYGPFEWCHKIGVENVYQLLDQVYQDTRDERYKICALLKKEFYSAGVNVTMQ